MSLRSRAGSGTRRRGVALATAVVVFAGLIQAPTPSAVAAAGDNKPKVASSDKAAPARPAPAVRPRTVDNVRKLAAAAPAVEWPKTGTAELALPSARTPVKASVGGLAVTVAPAAARTAAATRSKAAGQIRVETLDQAASRRAGVDGPVLRVTGAPGAATDPVRLTLDYRRFAGAYGGDFGPRLRMFELPPCALTTPSAPACAPRPLENLNNSEAQTLTATVQTGTAPVLLAAAAGDSSTQGNYGATPLAPSAEWNVAPSSGAYTWTYPIKVPPVPGGRVPGIALSYNSQTVDGRTTTTNNQGSWIGEGFGYEPGFVERQYKSCSDDGHATSPDLCWAYDNATISLNGRSSTLVRTGDSWRFADDDGSKIERLTNTVNGDDNNEYWKVTTVDGTQYFFGLNRLPGWVDKKEQTESVWTVPVYGDDKANAEDDKFREKKAPTPEPCYNATFAKAHCQQAWRWNLDHVKDLHGNVVSYFYAKEKNTYALAGKLDVNGTPYDRGGYLERIDYGQRDGAVYTSAAPAQVVFDTAERCKPTKDFACKPADYKESTASHWQDVPNNLVCAAGTRCKAWQMSPSFFTRKRLVGITTQIRVGSEYAPVDGWVLDHDFLNNGDGSRTLWMKSIQHSGYGGKKGASATPLPPVRLEPEQRPNRIDIPGDNVAPLVRPRLSAVYTEAGASINVNYADVDCFASSLPKPGHSTKRCYPVKWSPTGKKDPTTDWFHKYVVGEVIETDRTGGAPDQVTRYTYEGDAGWRYADRTGLAKDENDYRLWSQWRGYATVEVSRGNGQIMTTRAQHTYLRGLDGDKDPEGGKRSVTRKDSVGVSYTDADELAGFEIETAVYDGAKVISKSTTKPKVIETASDKHAWGTDTARFVLPEVKRAFTLLANGTWRETKSVTTYDTATGRVEQVDDLGDVSTDDDDKCVRNEYADNADAGIFNLISRKETVAVRCGATPDRATQVLVDERTYYDGKALGAPPTKGDVTHNETLLSHDGTKATYLTEAKSTYDVYGRPLVVEDTAGTKTTTTYTQVNGLTTVKKEVGPLGEVSTEYAVAWAHPSAQVDLNGKRTELAYDNVGRLISVTLPDRAGNTPNIKYTYSFQENKPVHVKTEKIKNDGTYRAEYQIYDGLLRPRQIQAEGPSGGRLVADTFYTPTGQVRKTNDTYYAAGAPSGVLLPAQDGDVDGQTEFLYDGLDRVTDTITLRAGDVRWRSVTTYEGGDRVSVTPPQGATPTTTVTNGRGQVVELLQYKGRAPSGAADRTRYTYTPGGQLATVTNQAGMVWRHFYDQRGREVRTQDPDGGQSRSTYDNLDRLTSVTNANDEKVTTTYDAVGRKIAIYQGDEKTGEQLASWTYDEVAKGQLYASTRLVNGHKYEIRTPRLDALYRPVTRQYVIPKADAGEELGGTYAFGYAYNYDGTVQTSGFPASGGLPKETVVYQYDDLQRVTRIGGAFNHYATDMVYDKTGELLRAELNTGGRKAWATARYEQGTKRLLNAGVTREAKIIPGGPADTTPVSDVDRDYRYDAAGNVLSIENTPASGQRDIQCFQYDYLRRMTEAWTSASTAEDPCAGGAATTGIGGVAPYHNSYTFDAAGNRLTETAHAVGTTPKVEREYTYREGSHALTSMTERSAAGDRLHTYEYDKAGSTIKRVRVGEEQLLDWDAEGRLASVTEKGKKTSFVYTADGTRILRKEPGTTTLYLEGMELRLNTDTKAVAGTRFYPVGNGAMVVRTVTGLQFQFADHHGTGQVAVDADSGAITHRRTDPYGNPRGQQPPSGQWLGEKGFVGGNQDTSTGLTHLGARLYDPALGRFISVDPLINHNDPQSMNAYAYAFNSPVTATDPTGLAGDWCATLLCADQTGGRHKVNGTSGFLYSNGYQNSDGTLTKKGRDARKANGGERGGEDPRVTEARRRAEKAKQQLIEAGKALGKILMDELGVTDAFDCVTKGEIGACAETVLNIAGAFVGGMVAKIARKYGLPWNWGKAADLGRKLWDLGGKIVDGIRTWMRETSLVRALSKSCNSFSPNTRVLMADGSRKRIKDIKPGEKVVATHPGTRTSTGKTVVATMVNIDADFTDLAVVDKNGRKSVIHTTQHHRFWSASRNDWVYAGDLRPGERLRSVTGGRVKVLAAANFRGFAKMHDLTVDDIHTYYVLAGNTPVLVHNCDVPAPSMADKPLGPDRPAGTGDDWTARTADNGKGSVWQAPGATGNANMVRTMNPTSMYPNGYVRFHNKHGQPIGLNGKPGSKAETHIPMNPDSTYPIPMGW